MADQEVGKGGRAAVVMFRGSPHLSQSDWWGWGMGPVMMQLHQCDSVCLKDRAAEQRTGRMKWFMLKGKMAKQMMLRSWPCSCDKISSLLLILNDSLAGSLFIRQTFSNGRDHVSYCWKGYSFFSPLTHHQMVFSLYFYEVQA